MPDSRRHRGPHPQDQVLFATETRDTLREAAGHLSWLLTRGYAVKSALKLVGDRFDLLERQRRAVRRSACSETSLQARGSRQVAVSTLAHHDLVIDGFNLLTTIEAALAGGVLLLGRDGCLRDMASMHGSYRRVSETRSALITIGQFCRQHQIAHCRWWLDRPVSNSARLRRLMLELAAEYNWSWDVELLPDPDVELCRSSETIVTADAGVLDGCGRWFNMAREIVATSIPEADIIDLSDSQP